MLYCLAFLRTVFLTLLISHCQFPSIWVGPITQLKLARYLLGIIAQLTCSMPESAVAPLIMQGTYPLPLEDFFFSFFNIITYTLQYMFQVYDIVIDNF